MPNATAPISRARIGNLKMDVQEEENVAERRS
jgi:hypothetical protein